jgi:hypothetical protein
MYFPHRVETYGEWSIPYQSEAMSSYITLRNDAADHVDPGKPTSASRVVPLRRHQDHAKARFRMLKRLKDNHDGEGARAANSRSVDHAIAFLDRYSFSLPILPTLDDDGFAVIEVHSEDMDTFADITFRSDATVECYFRKSNAPSQMFEGNMFDSGTQAFIGQFDVR